MNENNWILCLCITLALILLLSAYLKGTVLVSNVLEGFQMHLAQPSKCYSCENQFPDSQKWRAQPTKCFSCEAQSGFQGQPSKCFDCERQMMGK